jgi:hypothetical protein
LPNRADLGFGPVRSYRLSVVEDDLVLAQITRSILPFIGRRDGPSLHALDEFSLILGAHLLGTVCCKKWARFRKVALLLGKSAARRNCSGKI